LGYDLSVASQNRRVDEDGAKHMSRSSGMLCVEACRDRVSQSDLKIGLCAVRMVCVVSSWRLHRDQVEDGRVDATGCVRLCYPLLFSLY
jgi:hypothetical protein